MENQEVFDKVVEILKPFAKNEEALGSIALETSLQKDLEVNSARLVDIVLEIEDSFDIEVSDDDADQVGTVGDAVKLIVAATS
ncbi:MAG TPA: phosphopantetheine-binding protein [Candidatus Latescibacteria bacterium]|jgi:acyl carrier protein|nr:acyl carrier protein [Gemmatimonadaceae bacterium]MDP6015327.1 phosphopantetheine-binding protein [Candidatus Latescibacterota bacterium]HJP32002.1 phosphopantetheine-binding protein [Candidatus Latescibacterota bacterium]|tara:strand:+ start:1849 stop:2097 length:249 start_codon:yes stop_codon:yes gene_type:complete